MWKVITVFLALVWVFLLIENIKQRQVMLDHWMAKCLRAQVTEEKCTLYFNRTN